MSSWHNRQRRRASRKAMIAKPVVTKYVFDDGVVINDYGDGDGQHRAQVRLMIALQAHKKLSYTCLRGASIRPA